MTMAPAAQEKVNILLVDDQPPKLLSYGVILGGLGENLITAASAREAFDHLLRSEIAVILMDVQMPELDGFELAAMIRSHPRFERTAIIFVSAIHLTDFDQIRGYAAGAVDYVSVPIIPEVLRAKVRVFADLYRKTRQLERMNEELERCVAERTAELEASAQRLRDSEQRRSIALAAGSMGTWDWDSASGEHIWDEGQYRICGLEQSFRLTTDAIKNLLHPDDRTTVEEAATLAFQTGRPFNAEFRILRPWGEVRWCVASGVITRDGEGRLWRMNGVTYDITERKLAEQALAQMNEELERRIEERTREREAALAQLFEAQKLDTIGRLTGGVAHDFNNLLMAVLGSLELLRKRLDDQKSLRLLDNAFEGANRGAALTKRLLAFARRQELKPRAVDVAALIGDIKDLLHRALGPAVRLTLSFPDALPAVKIDPNQLELAILNLAVNARDAMPDGGSLAISAELVPAFSKRAKDLKPADYVCVSLVDSGVGMDKATLSKAMEPFFTTKGPGKGTGLGLPMVYGMAAQSGGALYLTSERGMGTKVELFLPLAAASDVTDEVTPPVLTMDVDLPEIPTLNILIVDDDPIVLAGTAAMLEDLGHVATQAASGSEALRKIAEEATLDLVITDYAMPGINGADLIQAITDRFPRVPTILASGYGEASWTDVKNACVHLPKPFNQNDLSAAIIDALASRLRSGANRTKVSRAVYGH